MRGFPFEIKELGFTLELIISKDNLLSIAGIEGARVSKQLEKIKIGVSAILGLVYVYIPEKDNPDNMLHKKDVTKEFEAIAKHLGWEKKDE